MSLFGERWEPNTVTSWLIVAQSFGLVLAGVALGPGAVVALIRVLKHLLFQVSTTDPETFVDIVLLFILMAITASYLPAYRDTGVDPMASLRLE
jgi:putative ABC transport system permease protein